VLVKIASKSSVVLKGAESRNARWVEGWCNVSVRRDSYGEGDAR